MNAYEKIKIHVDYTRPTFDFPDLSSESGNPYVYFQLAKNRLIEQKFKRESEELFSFSKHKYEKHFDIINKFLDFSVEKNIGEDDDYVYIRVKKSISQNKNFLRTNVKDLEDLVNNNFDFSTKNNYGRTILHYLTLESSFHFLLNLNKKTNAINLFDLDEFESTYLHGHHNFQTFDLILKEMSAISIEHTKNFFFLNNVFGNNAFSEFLSLSSKLFSSNLSEQNLISYLSIVNTIGLFDPKTRSQLIDFKSLKVLDKVESNKNFHTIFEKYALEFDFSLTSKKENKSLVKKV